MTNTEGTEDSEGHRGKSILFMYGGGKGSRVSSMAVILSPTIIGFSLFPCRNGRGLSFLISARTLHDQATYLTFLNGRPSL